MEDYCYSPLPTITSIRVLRVDRRSSDNPSDIHCTLRTVDLNDAPSFHALSYTWGNPHARATDDHPFTKNYNALDSEYSGAGRVPIQCNGKRLHVSQNLYDALTDVPTDAWRKFMTRKNVRYGSTILLRESLAGNAETVRRLIASGADLDVIDHKGKTALINAVLNGHLEVVKLLVRAGAKLDIEYYNLTALGFAERLDNPEIAAFLAEWKKETGEHTESELPFGSTQSKQVIETPEHWMWVDQLCINQEDLEERMAQVSLMHKIYNDATYTLVWLGRKDAYTSTAASVIPKLIEVGEQFVSSKIIPYSENSKELHESEGIPHITMHEWDSIAALFQRQYFRRLWVIQEVILSPIIVAYCGSVEVPWRDLCFTAEYIDHRQRQMGNTISSKYIPLSEIAARTIEEPIIQLIQWQVRSGDLPTSEAPKPYTLRNLVFDFCHYITTEPRDRIYGLYGLLSKNSNRPGQWIADYSMPVEQVYSEATERIILEENGLSILSTVIDPSLCNIKTLPSWVRDYTMTWYNLMNRFCSAAGNLPVPSPIISPSKHWNTLNIQGLQVDTVLTIGSTTAGVADPRRFFDPSWVELTLLLPSVYHDTGRTRTEVLWRTLCGDEDGSNASSPAPESFSKEFIDMVSRMVVRIARFDSAEYKDGEPSLKAAAAKADELMSWLKSKAKIEDIECEFSDPSRNLSTNKHQTLRWTLFKILILHETESPHPASLPTLDHILDMEKELESNPEDPIYYFHSKLLNSSGFHYTLRAKIGRRRLFVTDKRFLGLGPWGMKPGDSVWVLPGAGGAFILRKCDDTEAKEEAPSYKFIGEAYVYGIMNGEAANGREAELSSINLV
ncbi:hypothetical protein FQN57_006169 [Myotisia sp. PD_48]|nr:hypothetical protein FQN57_006169 [Myotisia sp. PD_48]